MAMMDILMGYGGDWERGMELTTRAMARTLQVWPEFERGHTDQLAIWIRNQPDLVAHILAGSGWRGSDRGRRFERRGRARTGNTPDRAAVVADRPGMPGSAPGTRHSPLVDRQTGWLRPWDLSSGLGVSIMAVLTSV